MVSIPQNPKVLRALLCLVISRNISLHTLPSACTIPFFQIVRSLMDFFLCKTMIFHHIFSGSLDMERMQVYSMVTLDTIFVRKSCRRRGLASEAVEDLAKDVSAPNNIGFSYPISKGMLKGIISITVPTLVTHVGVGL